MRLGPEYSVAAHALTTNVASTHRIMDTRDIIRYGVDGLIRSGANAFGRIGFQSKGAEYIKSTHRSGGRC